MLQSAKKVAAQYEAEAEKIKIVAKAEAEAINKKLQGKGIADQRREIAMGLEESVDVLRKVGIDPQEASALLVIVQHYDTLLAMGESASSNLVLLPSSPSTASNLMTEMGDCFFSRQQAGSEQNTLLKRLRIEQNPSIISLRNSRNAKSFREFRFLMLA